MLTFKRTYISSDTGPWSTNEYDVFEGHRHIGSIMLDSQGPQDQHGFGQSPRVFRKTLPTAAMPRRSSKRWKILSGNG
jgi:hypothetical protein